MDEERLAAEEITAWQSVRTEFGNVGIELADDSYDPLILAIEAWGERLAALRSVQSPEVRIEKLKDRVAEYDLHALFYHPDLQDGGG